MSPCSRAYLGTIEITGMRIALQHLLDLLAEAETGQPAPMQLAWPRGLQNGQA
jgi:hypothetical protein